MLGSTRKAKKKSGSLALWDSSVAKKSLQSVAKVLPCLWYTLATSLRVYVASSSPLGVPCSRFLESLSACLADKCSSAQSRNSSLISALRASPLPGLRQRRLLGGRVVGWLCSKWTVVMQAPFGVGLKTTLNLHLSWGHWQRLRFRVLFRGKPSGVFFLFAGLGTVMRDHRQRQFLKSRLVLRTTQAGVGMAASTSSHAAAIVVPV